MNLTDRLDPSGHNWIEPLKKVIDTTGGYLRIKHIPSRKRYPMGGADTLAKPEGGCVAGEPSC